MARILSSDHLAKYLKGGVYYDFLQYVKSDKELLTDKGEDTFHAITYEDFFSVLRGYYKSSKNIAWLDYLDQRYINMVH